MINPEKPLILNVERCARCGQPHDDIWFFKLQNPPENLDHYATCPTSCQPILIKVQIVQN